MEREQFTFYQSFAKAVSRIKSKAARCDAYDVIVNYALYGVEPDLEKIPDSAAIAFELIKPNLDASRRKAESGKSGGRPKQTESKPEANGKQTESKQEANGKQTASKKENKKEGKKEKEKENKCFIAPTREEVHEYVKQRNSSVDPDRFFDFYTADDDHAKHWIDSKGHPVTNWKQKLISWERRETDAGRSNPRSSEDSAESGAAKWGNLYS